VVLAVHSEVESGDSGCAIEPYIKLTLPRGLDEEHQTSAERSDIRSDDNLSRVIPL